MAFDRMNDAGTFFLARSRRRNVSDRSFVTAQSARNVQHRVSLCYIGVLLREPFLPFVSTRIQQYVE